MPIAQVLVVGAGMAGLAVARHLRTLGVGDVAVASAGGWESDPPLPNHLAPAARRSAGWSSANTHFTPMPGMDWRIGGRSLCWHGVALPIDGHSLSLWPTEVSARLTGGEHEGLYAATRRHLEHWRGAPLDAPTCPGDEVLCQELDRRGYSFGIVPKAATSAVVAGRRVWRAYTPLGELVGRDAGRDAPSGRLRLVKNHRALTVESGVGRGLSVRFENSRGDVVSLGADCVVLAAGTLENTRIYAQALARAHGAPTLRWPELATKIKHGLTVEPAPWMLRRLSPGDHVFLIAKYPSLKANLFFELHADTLGKPLLDLWWLAEPSERAVIDFVDSGLSWPGVVTAGLGSYDAALVQRRDRAVLEMLPPLGCRRVEETAAIPVVTHDAAREWTIATGKPARYVNSLGPTDHESGTVALGRELDVDFMSPSLAGLFVCGPATFPSSGAANPSLTILALARAVAESVVRYLNR